MSETHKGYPVYPEIFKTGNRVPVSAYYVDQHGVVTYHERHRTFPPCVGRKGECAFRRRVNQAKSA